MLRSLSGALLLSLAFAVGLGAQTGTDAWSVVSRGSLRSVLAPRYDIKLSSRAAGIVEKILVPEGSRITAGEPILSLNSQEEEAEVAQAKASLRGTEADYERAKNDFARMDALFKEKIASDKQFEESRSLLKVTQSRVDQAKAMLAIAEVRLENRTLRSPIDGIFLKTVKSVGEAVERFDTIARVVDASSLRFVVFGDYSLIGRFKPGQKVALQVQSTPEAESRVEGVVLHIDPIVDSTSGTFRIIIEVTPSDRAVAGLSALLVTNDDKP
ncbi:MAG TPA: efflux RND transporter periplasmic adaptor subunit, partial [Opitutaceae bacterium]|nr:efflux RND transporter periplasmic adaptor subunit [Opitutaceae bacterium]